MREIERKLSNSLAMRKSNKLPQYVKLTRSHFLAFLYQLLDFADHAVVADTSPLSLIPPPPFIYV